MSLMTSRPCYDAAQRLITLMQQEAPQLYQSFISYNSNETHYGFDGKPRWVPFQAQLQVDSGLYKNLVERACENYPTDDPNRWAVPSLARAIIDGTEIQVRDARDGESGADGGAEVGDG